MDIYVLSSSLLVIAAIISTRAAQRFGVPALVLFVFIGIMAGVSGVEGLEDFADYNLSLNVGLLALAVILFSGGLETRYREFRASLAPAVSLATFGVIIKMLVVGLSAYFLTPLGFAEGLLLGAVLAPTDAAAVFSVLQGRGLPHRLKGVLETESGTNDPVSIYLTLTLTTIVTTGQIGVGGLILGVVAQLFLGALLGFLFGRFLVWLINIVDVDSFGLYPVLALAGGLLAYSSTNLLGGNGFLAVYLTGLVLGNRALAQRQNIRYFMEGAAWGSQILMFLLLGLLVFPERLGSSLVPAFLVTLVLNLVARPVAVWGSLKGLELLTGRYSFSRDELTLISWAGLKGAVPIILAIVPLLARVPSGELIFNIVFVVVIFGTAVQGLTVVPLARYLDLLNPEPPTSPLRIELGGAAPPGSAVYDVFLEPNTRAVGKRLSELELPPEAVIAAIYRDKRLVTPRGNVCFEVGDHVYIISSRGGVGGIPAVFLQRIEGESAV